MSDRPIVSSCNSVTENISKFVDTYLQPAVKQLPAYVKDKDFVQQIESLTIPKNCIKILPRLISLYWIAKTTSEPWCKIFASVTDQQHWSCLRVHSITCNVNRAASSKHRNPTDHNTTFKYLRINYQSSSKDWALLCRQPSMSHPYTPTSHTTKEHNMPKKHTSKRSKGTPTCHTRTQYTN